MNKQTYCLDANVLIEAWQKYFSPTICPSYWDVLNTLGIQKRIFIPQMVYDEVANTEDDLAHWLMASKIPVRKIDGPITAIIRQIYDFNPNHKFLVDNTKQRSLADPWVIAHAIHERACVVTKEHKMVAANPNKIKIPNVCDNMSVKWMNDFAFIKELNIRFACTIKAGAQGSLFT